MPNSKEPLSELLEKIESLQSRQQSLLDEINALRLQVNTIQYGPNPKPTVPQTVQNTVQEKTTFTTNVTTLTSQPSTAAISHKAKKPSTRSLPPLLSAKSNLEKWVGENLINKIGIIILIIGVSIGAKYSIDNNLINPATRIVLGYLFACGLLFVGLRLKSKYESFSAVLVSGAMTIMYFITYLAYDLYSILPQMAAFVLMVIFTAFTVAAALKYNNQVIAHIGLVGAYAIPFLLSDGSGEVFNLFTYIAILNIGILATAFKKYWKPLYYAAFALTWVIYIAWFINSYRPEYFSLALIFLSLFFMIFYVTFLAYKLVKAEQFRLADIILLLSNSFVMFGIGYSILEPTHLGSHSLGLFTAINAMVHYGIGLLISRKMLADKTLDRFVTGLALVFITIAVPVELEGNWVTLLWAGEAALLFYIGRAKSTSFYENISYAMMILAFLSIAQDWAVASNAYDPHNAETKIKPIFNITFLSSLLFIGAFTFITRTQKKYPTALTQEKAIANWETILGPAILLITIYFALRVEIATYYNQLFNDSMKLATAPSLQPAKYIWNQDIVRFKSIWLINYSLAFLLILSLINIKWIQSRQLALINIGLTLFALMTFLVEGLFEMAELRESYLLQTQSRYYQIGHFNITIRYISYAIVTPTLITCYFYIRQTFLKEDFRKPFDFVMHGTILWICSSELINIMIINESGDTDRIGLSILWGVYSLLLIVLGIWKKKKHLRLAAIALFAVTLVKLFFYDIVNLDTIAKTVVFVSLGVLLLIISFLYNKYKLSIADQV